jgi:hypothetical protein
MKIFAALLILTLTLTSCQSSLTILDGATHACGTIHVEGYFTDTQGEVVIAKAPADWTPEQIQAFCREV